MWFKRQTERRRCGISNAPSACLLGQAEMLGSLIEDGRRSSTATFGFPTIEPCNAHEKCEGKFCLERR